MDGTSPDEDGEGMPDKRSECEELAGDLKKYLPFLQNIINNYKDLDIQDSHLDKLRSLYDMVEKEKLPASKLKCCQNVIDNLYNKYREDINSLVKNKAEKNDQLKDGQKKTMRMESKTTPSSFEEKLDDKAFFLSTSKIHSFSNEQELERFTKDDLLMSADSNQSSKTSKDCNSNGFSDSRLRLNKFIGIAANAALEKLGNTDTTDKMSESTIKELAKQVLDGLVKEKKAGMDILKGVELNGVDLNTVKEALKNVNINKSGNLPMQPPPLPPSSLLKLSVINSSIKSQNSKEIVESQNNTINIQLATQLCSSNINGPSNKPLSIRDKLTSDINILHKIGQPSTEPKQKCISALKPGTLLDLESSKAVSQSLHMESLRPTSIPNENKITKQPAPEVAPRDPRIRAKSQTRFDKVVMKTSSIQSLIPPQPLIYNSHKQSSKTNPLPGPASGQTKLTMLPGCTNIQTSFNQQQSKVLYDTNFTSQSNYRSSSQINQYRLNSNSQNLDQTKSYSPVQKQMSNLPSDVLVRPREQVHSYDDYKYSWRDSKSKRTDYGTTQPQYRNYKEYREAKYGKEHLNRHFSQGYIRSKSKIQEKSVHDSEKVKNDDKSSCDMKTNNPYNTYGVIKDSSGMKSFKIPKIKRNENVDVNIGNDADKEVVKNETANTEDVASKETKNSSNSSEIESVHSQICDTKYGNNSENETEQVAEENKLIEDLEKPKDTCKPKKPKKYSKEREFEKIVKEAVQISKLDVRGPRTRTRSTLLKNEDVKTKSIENNSPSKSDKQVNDKTSILTVNNKESVPKSNSDSDLTDVGQNVISSTSKDLDSTISVTASNCQVSEHSSQVISSSEINSTGELINNPNVKNFFFDLIAQSNPKLMSVITKLQDVKVIDKLYKLLDRDGIINEETQDEICASNKEYLDTKNHKTTNKNDKCGEDVDCNVEETVNSNMECSSQNYNNVDDSLNCKSVKNDSSGNCSKPIDKNDTNNKEIQDEVVENNKGEKVMDNEMEKNTYLDFASNNDNDDNSSDDDNFKANCKMMKVKRTKNCLNDLSDNDSDNTSFSALPEYDPKLNQNSHDLNKSSTNDKVFKEEKSPTTEFREIKIVIPKLDDNMMNKSNLNQEPPHKNISKNKCIEKVVKKPPKVFIGPLSKKKEMLNAKQNNKELIIITPNRSLAPAKSKKKKKKVTKSMLPVENKNMQSSNSLIDLPNASNEMSEILSPDVLNENTVSLQKEMSETDSKQDTINQTSTNTHITDNKSELKKTRPKMNELDKLHAHINDMYDVQAIINLPNERHCRTNKLVDYTSTNNLASVGKSKLVDMENSELDLEQNKSVSNKESKKKKKGRKPCSKVNTSIINTEIPIVENTCKELESQLSEDPVVTTDNQPEKPKKLNKLKISKKIKKKKAMLNSKKKKTSEINKNSSQTKLNVSDHIQYTDKEYYQDVENVLMKCKFCDYCSTNQSIVHHYKQIHKDEEVLPSRLPNSCAKTLINESIRENLGFMNCENVEETKIPIHDQNIDNYFTCVFCRLTYYDIIKFYDHITAHTGEYRYKCNECDEVSVDESNLEEHVKIHSTYDRSGDIFNIIYPNPVHSNALYGYLCPFCNFIQLNYNNMTRHMVRHHSTEDKKHNKYWTIIRVNMSFNEDNNSLHNSDIDYSNLTGCQPPLQYKPNNTNFKNKIKTKSGEVDNSKTKPSILELIAHAKQQLLTNPTSIKKEICEEQEVLNESSNLHVEQLTDLSLENNTSGSNSQSKPERVSPKYILKTSCTNCVVGHISCEQKDSILLYRCMVPTCFKKRFSSMFFNEFSKHIEMCHQLVNWNGVCDICSQTVETNSKNLHLLNALQHLVSYHLILDEDKQLDISNIYDVNDEQNLSGQQPNTENVVAIQQKPLVKLRVRHLPGDTLSTISNYPQGNDIERSNNQSLTNEVLVGETITENNADVIGNEDYQHDTGVTSTNMAINSVVNNVSLTLTPSNEINFNTYQPDGISTVPPSIKIVNVKSLKKGKKIKKRKYQANNSNTDNDKLGMWMMLPTRCESMNSDYSIQLEPGQQIINNGDPIDGTYYLIETDYNKNYEKQFLKLPVHVLKTDLAFRDMMTVPRRLGLFKCLDRPCSKIFTSIELFKLHMEMHYSNSVKKKKRQMYNTEQFKKCAYCFKTFDDVDSLVNHIAEKYTHCLFFCQYCFYRAYTASHVLVHQSKFHTETKASILQLQLDNKSNCSKEVLLAVDYNKFVLPYVCNSGHCLFSCYVIDDFITHSNVEHQRCDKFYCYICVNNDNGNGCFALQIENLIKHYKLHNINVYQCIYCLFGAENLDSMIIHLAMEHFEYNSLCLERSLINKDSDSSRIENLKILRLHKDIDNGLVQVVNLPADTNSLPEIMPHRTKKRRMQCPDVLVAAMNSAHIDGIQSAQSTGPIVITVPDQTSMINDELLITKPDDEFIMLNDIKETAQVNATWTETNNDEVIVIKDDDDDDDDDDYNRDGKTLSESDSTNINGSIGNSVKQKRLRKYSNCDVPKTKKIKSGTEPHVALNKLFYCRHCAEEILTSDDFKSHIFHCQYWINKVERQCLHCTKLFKNIAFFIEHIKSHGPNRFKCSLCSYYAPTQRIIERHMKSEHDISDCNHLPVNANCTSYERDEFVTSSIKPINKKNTYKCSECAFTTVTQKTIICHVKDDHDAIKYEMSLISQPTVNSCEYVVRVTNKQETSQQRPQRLATKRKCSTENINIAANISESTKPTKISQTETKCLFFSPDTIDNIPMTHIFPDLIKCSICLYGTKVRSNLILHFKGHKKGQESTTKDIVNPVPSVGKTELMFDKMINLAASSVEAMSNEKIKIEEIFKKIVEVPYLPSHLNLSFYPPFVTKNKRFKCSVSNCSFTGVDVEMLKNHISILHAENQCYECPHCPATLNTMVDLSEIVFHLLLHSENLYQCEYCDYIHYNCNEMKVHMKKNHSLLINRSDKSKIIVIRKKVADDNTNTNNSEGSSTASEWVCNICNVGSKCTENEIKTHIHLVHNLSNMFICPICQFEYNDDNNKIFDEHFKAKHPSVPVECFQVYKKISEEQFSNDVPLAMEYIQEQQALESLELAHMPSMCRGIPIEPIPSSSKLTKTRSVSKSPIKASKNSPTRNFKQRIATGNFNKDESLGTVMSNGHYKCPKCNDFFVSNATKFREHLYKEINYKTMWKCMECFEISDSPKKMVVHVKKHENVGTYQKIQDTEKLNWVNAVIKHQTSLLENLQNKEQVKKKAVKNIKTLVEKETCLEFVGVSSDIQAKHEPILNTSEETDCEVITLDDSDDE